MDKHVNMNDWIDLLGEKAAAKRLDMTIQYIYRFRKRDDYYIVLNDGEPIAHYRLVPLRETTECEE